MEQLPIGRIEIGPNWDTTSSGEKFNSSNNTPGIYVKSYQQGFEDGIKQGYSDGWVAARIVIGGAILQLHGKAKMPAKSWLKRAYTLIGGINPPKPVDAKRWQEIIDEPYG